ncbi:MAG: aminotransferase class I/II-fold pyridoxal phosphate-dependent enzyme [Desulfobacterales bacterium]|nr:aminotransferase class I/II-fold pyridoxal phosphate-dependent enzyme [Desulfobacterales bacterium]
MSTLHGGNIINTAKELGCRPDQLIDMSSNLSPLGMVPGLDEVLRKGIAEIAYLPETASESLVQAFADKHGLSPANILAGNGTTEFIYNIPLTLADRLRHALIVTPTYGDYDQACAWAGLPATHFPLRRHEEFRLDLHRLQAQLSGRELVFICNPNNPTSGLTASADLNACIRCHPDTLFVVDESYLPFVRERSLLSFPLPENLCLLRSFSKIYGIPGLRLGFLAADAKIMARITSRHKPWGVNRLAQIAGEYLLKYGDARAEENIRFVEQNRPAMAAALAAMPGVEVIPGTANFILNLLKGETTVEYLREKLLEQRIMIRNCANFVGLDEHYFRISLKTEEENRLFINACGSILK